MGPSLIKPAIMIKIHPLNGLQNRPPETDLNPQTQLLFYRTDPKRLQFRNRRLVPKLFLVWFTTHDLFFCTKRNFFLIIKRMLLWLKMATD